MPKLKTKKAMKKRFRITKNGKVMCSKSFRRHLLTDRSSKRKRQARGWHEVDITDVKRIKAGLPYDR
ncbi:MAG: 50S ribosomal protein L35 [Candidatus Omnitrophica bacterium]|nr:50S ribosomal protein L35 [Candidatus Omnitrophota bacterium]